MRGFFVLAVLASTLLVAPSARAVGQCKSPAVAVNFSTLCAQAMRDGIASSCLVIQYGEAKGLAMNGKLRSGVEFLVIGYNCQEDFLKESATNPDVWTTLNGSALLRGTLWGLPAPKVSRTQLARERAYIHDLVSGQAPS